MLKRTAKPENAQPAAKRKLTRAERKQIEAIIRQAKGDGKPHTVQDSIPFRNLYPDGSAISITAMIPPSACK